MMISKKRFALNEAVGNSEPHLDDLTEMSPKEYHDLIRETLEDLEKEGLIYDTGRRRNGQVVYARTPKLKERN
jgi:hypothetical protein